MSAKNNVQNGLSSRAGVKILQIFFPLCCGVILMLAVLSTAAVDDWSVIEEEAALEQRAREVNEGELQLLDRPPETAAHLHQNRLLITEQSLRDGWVAMYQCHSNLDKVSASQIVYNKERIRNIRVLSSQNIGSVRVEGHTVQMKDIAAESEICISADKRALSYEKGKYYLKLGPFMRRFLDGYYPMHVQVEVRYPAFLQLVSASPVDALRHTSGKTSYADFDLWVVGKLDIELVFSNKRPEAQ
jgi:hypothetical protein